MIKFEVKVIGHPKPKVKWLKHGEEILPSDEFQIENLDDGTSILIINDVYPDDTGEIKFEAYNVVGVAETTTQFEVVEGKISLETFRMQNINEIYRFLKICSNKICLQFLSLIHLTLCVITLVRQAKIRKSFENFKLFQKSSEPRTTGSLNGSLIWRKCKKLSKVIINFFSYFLHLLLEINTFIHF